jgi:hypothetical protein
VWERAREKMNNVASSFAVGSTKYVNHYHSNQIKGKSCKILIVRRGFAGKFIPASRAIHLPPHPHTGRHLFGHGFLENRMPSCIYQRISPWQEVKLNLATVYSVLLQDLLRKRNRSWRNKNNNPTSLCVEKKCKSSVWTALDKGSSDKKAFEKLI